MLITWKYCKRDTILQRFDRRARIIFMLAMLFSAIQFWDLRILLASWPGSPGARHAEPGY